MELKKKVVSGFVWTASEKFGSMFLQLVVSVILARLLDPSDFSLFIILTAIAVVGTTIVDSGFSQALIQRKDCGQKEYTSVFWLNVIIGILLYGILIGLARPLSIFYDAPEMMLMVPVIFTVLPITSLGIIQSTILAKEMRFGRISFVHIISAMISGITAIWMAVAGYGMWALVCQFVMGASIRTSILWMMSPWRPSGKFVPESLRGLFGYGSRLFATGVIAQSFMALTQAIMGKLYPRSELSFYDRGLKYKDMVAGSVNYSILTVSFPAFSTLQDDPVKFRDSAGKVVSVVSFLLFPVMAGLIAVADEIFPLLLTAKWNGAIPYFKIFCLSAVSIPVSSTCLNVLKASGDSRLVLRLEIIKKLFALAVTAAALMISVKAVVLAYFIWTFFEACLNGIYTRKKIGYSLSQQLRDTLPYLGMSLIMFGGVIVAGAALNVENHILITVCKILTGIIIYTILNLVFRPAAYREAICIIREWISAKK